MKPKGETKTNYVHKKRRYRELCIVSTKVFLNKSWNIANLRFFVTDCPEKSLLTKKTKQPMLFVLHVIESKPFTILQCDNTHCR